MNKNIIFYAAIAIVVAAVAYFVAYLTVHGTYSLSLQLVNTNTSGLFTYNTTRFAILVNNTGSSYISSMLVGFYVNGAPYANYNVSIPVGKTATVLVNYTYVKGGTYSFEAEADPAHLIQFSGPGPMQANLTVHVSPASPVDPFSSIPSENVTASYVFAFPGRAIVAPASLYSTYNLSITRELFQPTRSILASILSNVYTMLNASYGAFASYADGSSAQSVWLQGTFPESAVIQVAHSFGFPYSVRNGTAAFSLANGTTMCIAYVGGWTRIVTYSGNASCASLPESYNESQTELYNSTFYNGSALMRYLKDFAYTNSTFIGTQFGISNATRYASEWFTNANSLFVSHVNESQTAQEINSTCYGLISNGTVCSTYVLPGNGTSIGNFSLIRSEQVYGNFSLSLYSFVKSSEALSANYNAAMLLRALANGTLQWKSAFPNTCGFNSTFVNCTVKSFNDATHVATVSVKNALDSAMRIGQASCFMPGMQANESINETVAPLSYAQFNVTCRNIPVPIIGIRNSYSLYVNYSIGGSTGSVTGFLNVSNVV